MESEVKGKGKTNEQLLGEIGKLNEKITDLEKFKAEQKHAEEELLRSKILLESSIESPRDMIILSLDREYRYLYFNKSHSESMSQVYGTQPQVGDCIFDYMASKEDIENVKAHYDRAMNGEGHIAIEEFGEDNLRYYYEIRFNPIYNEKNEIIGITSFAQNITERKRVEEALKESERKLQQILATVPLGIGLIIDRQLGWSNDRMHEMLGYPKGDLIGKNASILYENENESNRVGKIAYEMMKKNGIGEVETQWKRKDNSLFDCFIRIAPLNISNPSEGNIAVISDITERKQVEEIVLKEKNKALQYLNIAEVMLVSIDSSGIVKLINPKGCEILGYSEEEIVGQNWFDRVLPERLKENVKEVSKKVLAGEMESVKYYENEVITKTGEERLIAWHNAVYKDDKGKVIGTLSSGEDITDRKQTEEALRESEEKFRHIFSVGKDGILIVDSESRIYMANITLCEMLGYGQDELIRFKMDDILHKDNLTQIHEKMELLARAEISIAEDIPLLKKDGSIVPTDIKASPISLNGKPYIIGAIRDITERKLAEEELTKHREHLEELVKERTKELEDKNKELDRTMKVFVGREVKIRDLEKRIRIMKGGK